MNISTCSPDISKLTVTAK